MAKDLPKTGTCYCGCGRNTNGYFVTGHDAASSGMVLKLIHGSTQALVASAGFGPGSSNLLDEYCRRFPKLAAEKRKTLQGG